MSKINRIIFLGSKSAGLRCVNIMFDLHAHSLAGIITFDDSKDSRSVLKKFSQFSSTKRIPLFIVEKSKDIETVIGQLTPDLCLICGWYWMIPPGLIKKVKNGFLGFHFSLLPKYRGFAPVVWAMIRGDKVTGVTLFSVSQGVDSGDVWMQRQIKIGEKDYISDVLHNLELEQEAVLREQYIKIINRQIKPAQQNSRLATYYRQRFPADGNIDWQDRCEDIYNFIRAQSEPYPGAFTYFKQEKLTIWRAHATKMVKHGIPGEIVNFSSKKLAVICGDKRLLLLEEVGLNRRHNVLSKIIPDFKGRLTSSP